MSSLFSLANLGVVLDFGRVDGESILKRLAHVPGEPDFFLESLESIRQLSRIHISEVETCQIGLRVEAALEMLLELDALAANLIPGSAEGTESRERIDLLEPKFR